MPAWNRERYVEAAIESIRAQTLEAWELVVVDDGSEDGTRSRVARIDDPRIRLLERPHGGISRALNAGLRWARGDWLARLDSDDVWEPEYLERQLAVGAEVPEAVAVYCRAEAADEDLEPLGTFRGAPPAVPDDTLAGLLLGDFTCNITVMARTRDVVAAGGWDERIPYSEDWELWLRLARRGPFVFHPAVLGRYREHDRNISRVHWADVPDVRTGILRRHLADPDLPDRVRPLRRRALRRQHVDAAMVALDAGRRNVAWRSLRAARREGDGLLPLLGHCAAEVLARHVLPRSRETRRLHHGVLALRDRWRRRGGAPRRRGAGWPRTGASSRSEESR